MKILIDTNIFLDFYRSKNESLRILTEIINNSENVILTEQIVNEFYRNRTRVLREVKKVFEKESNVENISSSFLDSLVDYADFQQLHNNFKQKRQEIKTKIDEIISDISSDPVAKEFKEFVDKKIENEELLSISDAAFKKAETRKKLGNPPASDKYSIGDELNWEIVLENINEDIVIVGRDKTYNENYEFLRHDFHKKTGRFINLLTNRISDAFNFVGKNIEELNEIENQQIIELSTFSNFFLHNNNNL